MPLSVHSHFVLQLLTVLKERPWWLTCGFIPVIEICALKCRQDQLSSWQSCKANQHLSSAKLCLPSVSAWFWVEQNVSKSMHRLYGLFATHAAWKTWKWLNTQELNLNKLWTWKTDLQSVWVWDLSTTGMECPCYLNHDVLLTWLQTLVRTEQASVFIIVLKGSRN